MSNISPPQAPSGSTPAGWYADPSGRHEFRYWDGASWTYDVSNHGVRSQDAGYRPGHHDAAEEKPERSGGGSGGFWTSFSGVLTAVAAVTTAAGGIFFATKGNDTSAPPVSEQSLIAAVDEAGVDDFIESNPDPAPGYSDYMTVTDDSGLIRVDVPVEWSDIDGSAYVSEDGTTETPAVTAASDLDGFLGSYDSPGVEVRATDISVTDVPTALADFEQIECTSYGSQSYEDPAFVGEIELYAECPGTDTVVVVLAAEYKPDPDRIAIVVAQLVEDRDIEALGRALDTFDFT